MFISCLILSLLILFLFYSTSFSNYTEFNTTSSFECGFTSFSSSSFSFSIHYLLFVFLFLLLDLEFSLTFWFFYSSGFLNFSSFFLIMLFLLVVLLSLLYEWYSMKLDWTY